MGNITVSQVFLKHKAGEVYLHAHRHIFCTFSAHTGLPGLSLVRVIEDREPGGELGCATLN